MMKWIPLLCWTMCFAVLNYGAKSLVQPLPPVSSGMARILWCLISSSWFYILILLYAACTGLYLLALRMMPLSVAGPVFTVVGSLTAFVLGICLFQESVTPEKLLGIGLTVAGIAFLVR